jgi:hypothetical protein
MSAKPVNPFRQWLLEDMAIRQLDLLAGTQRRYNLSRRTEQ